MPSSIAPSWTSSRPNAIDAACGTSASRFQSAASVAASSRLPLFSSAAVTTYSPSGDCRRTDRTGPASVERLLVVSLLDF